MFCFKGERERERRKLLKKRQEGEKRNLYENKIELVSQCRRRSKDYTPVSIRGGALT